MIKIIILIWLICLILKQIIKLVIKFGNYSNSNFADTGLSEWESMAMWDDC